MEQASHSVNFDFVLGEFCTGNAEIILGRRKDGTTVVDDGRPVVDDADVRGTIRQRQIEQVFLVGC